MQNPEQYDVVIVGAGAAGLSAAMVLGRQRRKVLLVDTERPRNAPATEMHMFLTRDGADPASVRQLAGEELKAYPSIERRTVRVSDITGTEHDFTVSFEEGEPVGARQVMLATGLVDLLPEIPGLAERFGRTVVHCPFCHGWESRDKTLAVLSTGPAGPFQALYVADRYSDDVVLLSDPSLEIEPAQRAMLEKAGVRIDERPVTAIEGDDTVRIVFADGDPLEREAMFVFPATQSGSDLGERLGAEVLPDGALSVDAFWRTTVPGVSAIGDAGRAPELPGGPASVARCAGSGVEGAMWLDKALFQASMAALQD